MKKLSKLKLNNASALNDKEMRDIVGGSSSVCQAPESLFWCKILIGGSGNSSGHEGNACALSRTDAEERTRFAFIKQMMPNYTYDEYLELITYEFNVFCMPISS